MQLAPPSGWNYRRCGVIIGVGWAIAMAVGVWSVVADDSSGGERLVESLTIEPAELVLHHENRQQVLVTAHDQHGRLFDVTRAADLSVIDPSVASISHGKLQGLKDGSTNLLVRYGGREARVPVRVAKVGESRPVHFANDVVPVLSKLGCNSGGCHGKASGQNGFKLSVFGFDPEADHAAILKEGRGRRVSSSSPERSLILLKSTAQVPHGGGRRMEVGSPDYEVLRQWLWQGMPLGRDDAPHVVALRASPVERVFGFQSSQQILATAEFSDGSLRDVTDAAAYTSNSGIAAEVDGHGLVRTGRVPGEAAITVQYMGQVAAVRVLVPRSSSSLTKASEWPANNDVDRLVWAKLQKMGAEPSGLADDATFLRRLFLDTIGTLPKADEVRAFLADTRADKRARAIDAVLARDEYADYWTLQWADVLLVNRDKLGDRGAFEFHRWLREQFARNRPYNVWVRELIVASGRSDEHGPVNFYRAVRTPEQLAESVSQAFLGVRVQCAQCHHHPFEKWSQSDFYGMAGFFNGLERKPVKTSADPITALPRPNVELVYHAGHRETRMPLTDQPVATRPLDGWQSSPHAPRAEIGTRSVPATLTTEDPRVLLADWLTDPSNPWFARLVANRLWKHYLGRGLVEPEDDLRSTNPATNEPLLDWLAQQVVENHYDLKAVMRLILNSRAYQLSADPNDTNRDDEQNFSHHYVRRLPAEVLLDAISEVTGSPEAFPGRPRGTRAIELWDNQLPSYFLDTFGRSERSSPCECGRSGEPTMAQALHLMNAPEVTVKIANPAGRVARLLQSQVQADDTVMIEELSLAALGRMPTEKERNVARNLFTKAARRDAAEDFLWTLLNSYDFLFVR